MKKVALTELDPRLQKQVAAAEQQLKTNPQYAMEILNGILARTSSAPRKASLTVSSAG